MGCVMFFVLSIGIFSLLLLVTPMLVLSFFLTFLRLKIEAQPGLGILKYNKKRSLAKNFEKNISFRLSIYSLPRIKTLNVN